MPFVHPIDDREQRIYASHVQVREKLRLLGVPLDTLKRAAQIGFVERANANMFDPVTAGGFDAWRYPTRSLRQDLFTLGWRIENPQNLPLIVSDEHRVIVTVSSGDEWTGRLFGGEPKTKNPKGSVLKAVVEKNFNTPDLFGNPEEVQRFVQTMEYPIWVFLLQIADDAIQAELSCPMSLDGNSQISEWSERIILDITPPDSLFDDDREPENGPDILPDVQFKI